MWTQIRQAARILHNLAPRPMVNFAYNLVLDMAEAPARFHPGARPRPWRSLHNVGGGDFHHLGRIYADWIGEALRLRADHTLLDMGCGAGRLMFPLAERLGEGGRYIGFDVSRRALGWARRHAPDSAAEFDFVHADLANAEYGAAGGTAAAYRFPADDDSVDGGFAISLFTHLKPEDAAHYFKEAARVLKPGGRLALTAYLIDDEAREAIAAGRGLAFAPWRDGAWVLDARAPERAVAFERGAFDGWIEAAGLGYAGEIARGAWTRRAADDDYQDRIVLEKPA
ncbi:MAG: class I SAM-dependent methyltransferase [Pseudomonadota bacterium]